MKTRLLTGILGLMFLNSSAQEYPVPEFSNEVYLLKKISGPTLVRLEKETVQLDTKVKAGRFGGSESSYSIDQPRSVPRLPGGAGLSFVYTSGNNEKLFSGAESSNSLMRASGIDPSMIQGLGAMNDPTSGITLYRMDVAGSMRKIIA